MSRCRGWSALRLVVGVPLAALGFAACAEPAEPDPVPASHRSVYAVLEVGSPVARLIGREIAADGSLRPLAGATVDVSGTAGAGTLRSTPSAAADCFVSLDGDLPAWGLEGCYAGVLSAPVQAAGRYSLTVTLPDGSRVAGSLTTPAVPDASIPADSQRVSILTYASPEGLPIAILPIVLASAAGAGRVDAFTTVRRGWKGRDEKKVASPIDPALCTTSDRMLPFRLTVSPDTKDFWIYSATCRGSASGWDSLDVDVHVVAADPNYSGYANTVLSGLATPQATSGFGLTGAVGVFGALAERVLPVRLRYCGPRPGVLLCPELNALKSR